MIAGIVIGGLIIVYLIDASRRAGINGPRR